MNNKITFPKLASLLAEKSGRSKRFSEDFLRELFALVSEQLEAGESVKIKGLGTFRLIKVEPRKSVDVTSGQPIEISGHNKVVFTPAKELAEEINSPFEAFSPVEIADNVDLGQIMNDASDEAVVEAKCDQEEIDISPVPVADVPSGPDTDISPVPVADVSLESLHEEEPSATRLENIIRTRPVVDADEIIYVDENPVGANREKRGYSDFGDSRGQGGSWFRILAVCTACAIFAIVLTFLIWSLLTKPDFSNVSDVYADDATEYANELMMSSDVDITPEVEPEGVDDREDDQAKPADAEAVATQPSDALVFDTIGKARFLTTMAKDHYGNNKFWPYIYEANKNHIGHPDRIRPGTAILIPKLSKYGVDPTNPNDEEKANKLGAEIYSRYGKSL